MSEFDRVAIEERLVSRIGVREWGLPTMVMPGQIWRSEDDQTVSCMVAAEDKKMVAVETLPLEVLPAGEYSELPLRWRHAMWQYVQAWPLSGCGLGPLLAISEQERNEFIRRLRDSMLVKADDIGIRSVAHKIGLFASWGYELYSDRNLESIDADEFSPIPDWVTCINCQACLSETKGEHPDDWPEWLDMGCCSPECWNEINARAGR